MATLSTDAVKQPFWSVTGDDALLSLQANTNGLTDREAAARLRRFGPNVVTNGPRFTRLRILGRQLASPFIVVLCVAGGITTSLGDVLDSVVIFGAAAVNIALGYWQEHKAERILMELTRYVRTTARVTRNGTDHEIDASELVPGDIIRLSQGMRVPADGRILAATSLEVDESILSGEALPEEKGIVALDLETPLAERTCMVYGGTLVLNGLATVVVTATGHQTEVGRIARLSAMQKNEPSPLQQAVSRFSRVSAVCLTLFAAGVFAIGIRDGYQPVQIFVISVAVAVSAVPESLPIALTVIMAIGVERLAKRKGVVRRLLAAETLGSTSVILTDKTGTLTQAKMSISAVTPWKATGKPAAHALLMDALLNADVVIENPDEDPATWRVSGRPLETSLVRGAAVHGIRYPDVYAERTVIERLPFDARLRYSMALFSADHGVRTTVLGAPETIIGFSTLTEDEKLDLLEEVNARAENGERVLALASIDTSKPPGIGVGHPPRNLDFRGLIVFHDPLRPSAKAAVQRIEELGVRTVILTGDHRGTALSVAHELGMLKKGEEAMTGAELDQLTDDELIGRLDRIRVFARATPEHKLRMTRLFKQRGDIVAVTGDGVNDAPALRSADIGVAVGSGTEVAKNAADLVILDDNFETLVAAVTEGRRILQNIRKVMVYLLSDSLDEVILVGGALLLGIALPLNALQILFVNLFSDSFPAIAFAFEHRMDDGRRRRGAPKLFDAESSFLIFIIGTLMSAVVFALYAGLLSAGYPIGLVRTFTYALFATNTLFVAFALRSLHASILTFNPLGNPQLTSGVAFGLGLTLLSIYFEPLARVLHNEPLPFPWLASVVALGLVGIVFVEIAKWLFSRRPG